MAEPIRALTNRREERLLGGMNVPPPEMFHLPGGTARIEWRRNSRARRVSLRIDPSAGNVVVTLPLRAGRGAGVALLMTHADWVTDRLAALPDAVPFADGAPVPIDGMPKRIRHVPHARGGVWLEGDEVCVSGAPEFLRRRVLDFLRAEARRRLAMLAIEKAALIGAQVRRVAVKDTRSRWGSCASDGSLAFSWRLIMAPAFVQDYVVAHEVAHLRCMNHGKRFWALVDQLTPHTAAAVQWFRGEGSRLLRIG
ncbi:MAG TPA: SprT family zinc-dependent metalloprotease [Acetobacteraceae bacterium]|nr:SprT family zinc-dependent metalloprotease [Acetobacteraceae bacterium]